MFGLVNVLISINIGGDLLVGFNKYVAFVFCLMAQILLLFFT